LLLASVSFKIMDSLAVEVPVGDAARLGLHLAVFGSDEELARWRLLAEKIATAVSLAERDGNAILHLTERQKRDVAAALDAMREDRGGMLATHCLRFAEHVRRRQRYIDCALVV
jgi:hypothetical protein